MKRENEKSLKNSVYMLGAYTICVAILGCEENKYSHDEEEKENNVNIDAGIKVDLKTLSLHCPGDLDEHNNGNYTCTVKGMLTNEDYQIKENLIWIPDITYILDGIVSVEGGASLAIQPGTTVMGDTGSPSVSPSSLFVSTGSTLHAVGTQESPIIFTSSKAQGMRAPGDWGGIVIRGDAPVNTCSSTECGQIQEQYSGRYGGQEYETSSGALAYVRIEFAGRDMISGVGSTQKLAGLQLIAVGSKTDIHHVHVQKPAKEGLSIVGGSVPIRHVIISGAGETGLEWSGGWIGRGQFIVIHNSSTGASGYALKGINYGDMGDDNVSPRSNPSVYNVTIAGLGVSTTSAIYLGVGTAGTLANVLLAAQNGYQACLDIDGESAWVQATSGALEITGTIFPTGNACFADNDVDFLESEWWKNKTGNRLLDVQLAGASNGHAPSFVQTSGTPAISGAVAPPTGVAFFETVQFVGAMGDTDWAIGWTAYPAN